MKSVFIYFLCFAFTLPSFAQDSTRVVRVDSVLSVAEEIIEIAQTAKLDTSKKFRNMLGQVFGVMPYSQLEKPKVAFVRSLIVPGWGQITNKQYGRMGLVYLAAAGGGYAIDFNNKRYKIYLSHYEKALRYNASLVYLSEGDFSASNLFPFGSQFYISDNKKNDIFYLQTAEGVNYNLEGKSGDVEAGEPESYFVASEAVEDGTEIIGAFNISTFKSAKDLFRRQRGLSIIGIGAGWLFFALEANVAAHLKTFNMSEDISWKVSPAGPNTFGMSASGVKLSIMFD